MLDTAVVIISCKRFEQVWDPFFILFKRYWPDCPFKIYFITDFGKPDYDFINVIEVGRDLKFSSNLIHGLNNIVEKFIVFFQEDYLFLDNFNTPKILELVQIIKDNPEVGCLRLAPCPGPTANSNYSPDLGIVQFGDEYRTSAQTAIWDKQVLLSLLKENETGWDFEIRGTFRSNFLNKIFLSVLRGQSPVPYYITAVTKGKWEQGALDLLKRENISTDKITKVIK